LMVYALDIQKWIAGGYTERYSEPFSGGIHGAICECSG